MNRFSSSMILFASSAFALKMKSHAHMAALEDLTLEGLASTVEELSSSATVAIEELTEKVKKSNKARKNLVTTVEELTVKATEAIEGLESRVGELDVAVSEVAERSEFLYLT